MQTTIEQDGEDLVAVLPDEILEKAGLAIGDAVTVSLQEGAIVIEPAAPSTDCE